MHKSNHDCLFKTNTAAASLIFLISYLSKIDVSSLSILKSDLDLICLFILMSEILISYKKFAKGIKIQSYADYVY